MATIIKLLDCLAANPRWSSGKASGILCKRSGFESSFDLKYRPSFLVLETRSITNQKFSVVKIASTMYETEICVGATSSSREELILFINSVNSFHPALKYTWEISENSLAFLDIKLSINDNGLSTSVHYKPTDSHNYLLNSSSHPQHVKNAITFSQFLRQETPPQ